MASDSSKSRARDDGRLRATAVQQAQMIEEKKQLRSRITDLVVECFDLPSQPVSSAVEASVKDTNLFRESLNLFQPSDFDDLVLERNIDGRCGYALCSNPNQKAPHEGRHVWSNETGFFVDRADFERWCSKECRNRGSFVRVQLRSEPAWLREGQSVDVRLLDEVGRAEKLADALKDLAITNNENEEAAAKLKELSDERGDSWKPNTGEIGIVERHPGLGAGPMPQAQQSDLIEGHTPQKVQFHPNQTRQ